MSAFLAPIHHWLFKKIRLVEDREQYIYRQAAEMCGSTAEEIREQVRQTYGSLLPEQKLEDLIEYDNIHGWLQRQINVVETREAAMVKELTDTCGEAGVGVAAAAFAEHGAVCGKEVKANGRYDTTSAKGIYQALNDYFLNGMPCDQADMVVENTADKVVWQGAACLKEKNWVRAGISPKSMKDCYQEWLAAFVHAVNPGFTYRQVSDLLAGDPVTKHEIIRTS